MACFEGADEEVVKANNGHFAIYDSDAGLGGSGSIGNINSFWEAGGDYFRGYLGVNDLDLEITFLVEVDFCWLEADGCAYGIGGCMQVS